MPGPVVAHCGRRIDDSGTKPPAFPLANVNLVAQRLRGLLAELRPAAVVSSAANGADLLLLLVAGELKVPQHVILPFDVERFKKSSVTDRPDARWGPLFDQVVREARAAGTLTDLGTGGSDDVAYAAANEGILHRAKELAQGTTPIALVVWEYERPMPESDFARDFAKAAVNQKFVLRIVQTSSRSIKNTPNVAQAKAVLQGKALDANAALALCLALRRELAFSWARDLAQMIRMRDGTPKALQFSLLRIEATCTYKDLALPAETRLARAVKLLRDARENLDTETDPEVLGLAGAIYKRWWEYDGQRWRLERALRYYQRGYGADEATDNGYQAINAAYCLDQLARLDLVVARDAGKREDGTTTIDESIRQSADAREAEARRIREMLVDRLPTRFEDDLKLPAKDRKLQGWWFIATVAEAYLGLDQHDKAKEWLSRGAGQGEDWEYEATATQMASLARARHALTSEADFDEKSPAWLAVRDGMAGIAVDSAHSAFLGKFGLALSGGGFRAAFYHLGLLARLAELDVLRSVEVISCVSGGSIVGALYYLEVRHLLETTPDDQITCEHYIAIVQRIQRDFLAGVRTDIRSRLVGDARGALRDAFSTSISQTTLLGELLETTLYSEVPDGEGLLERRMADLYIEPARNPGVKYDRQRAFNPRLENWGRRNKVPILIINATTLNTGHLWQFTTSWMGEPETRADQVIGYVQDLRPTRYTDAPPPHDKMRLGWAVAASAAVPGVFDPLTLVGLFPSLVLRLSDGGVHDNQGTASLLDQDCSSLVISDGSGQLSINEDPGTGRLDVPIRANDVLMARVRELEFQLVAALRRSAVLRRVVFVHLTQGLAADKTWTPYGMRQDVQALLARVRTDLDAFNDLEAYALMQSAYLATTHEWTQQSRDFPRATPQRAPWPFDEVATLVAADTETAAEYSRVKKVLAASQRKLWKVAALSPALTSIGRVVRRVSTPFKSSKPMTHRVASAIVGTLTAVPLWIHRRIGRNRWLKAGRLK